MDEVEGDFQFYYRIDLRDFWRESGGSSRLTLRRLLVLVDRLPPESEFKSAVEDRPAVSELSAAIFDVYSALVGEVHPRWDQLKKQRQEAEFAKFVEEERAIAHAHNKKYLKARKT